MSAVSLVLLALLAQTQPLASAPQAKAQAQVLLGQGSKLYQAGDVAGALEKFNAAYDTYASPKLMFNIGQANRDLGRPVEALEAFGRFLSGATDASPDTVADARRSVAELQNRLGRIQIDCATSGAEVSVDGKSVGVAPLPGAVWVTPGRHQVTARHDDSNPAVEDVVVTANTVSAVTLFLAPMAARTGSQIDLKTPGPRQDRGWLLGRKWTWVAAGSTVLLTAGAITVGLLMQSKFDSLRKSCGIASQSTVPCSQSDIDSVSTRKTTANVLWGLAGAGAITTGILFFVEGRPVAVAPTAGEMNGFLAQVRY